MAILTKLAAIYALFFKKKIHFCGKSTKIDITALTPAEPGS
jgi:hypothetical protein